ncbi:Short-chain dehydrogenase/reductase eriB [Fulvia fulva]|nr:Short-chain dehydrogenase/reductase eriB [Fulvia fulva]
MAFNPAHDIKDLSGKVILITGGNTGLGASKVKALAAHNPTCIYLCCRKIESGQAVVDSIHQTIPKANIQILQLDLSSFDSVKKCAADFNAKSDRLDLLFLNAGISATSPALSKEGYEQQFGVNHMGHALFAQLLMPKLLETQRQADSDVRIIVTSSIGGHRIAPKQGLVLDQMKTDGASIAPMVRYGHSKLANMLFARKLAQLYPSITTTSYHPGTVKTDIWGKAEGVRLLAFLVAPIVWATGVDSDTGVQTALWLATAEKGQIENGRYYAPKPFGKPKEGSKWAVDQKQTDELWEWTNEELAKHGGPDWPEE